MIYTGLAFLVAGLAMSIWRTPGGPLVATAGAVLIAVKMLS